ncbi:MAG: TetR/AcrR family transcriptional regulator [Paludibacteraceae bacterium]|jgi:AcrR family transcriptional regulator|nr:TetR/AcrR family transcriptional regulator [Paludibacteraceae bacterium]
MTIEEQILNVSAKLFIDFGVKSVSIDDICARLHISKKTFYVYFKQKEDLLSAILREERTRREKKLAAIEADSKQNVINAMIADTRFFVGHKVERHMCFFYDLKKYYPNVFFEHKKEMAKVKKDRTERFLHKGIDEGLFRNDLNISTMALFLNMLSESFFEDFQKERKAPIGEIVNFLIDTLMRSIVSTEGLKYYEEMKKEIEI